MLGFLQGFQQLAIQGFKLPSWPQPRLSNIIGSRLVYYGFEIQCDAPEGRFFAAVLLNQPWSFAAIRELHDLAGLIMFNILDTISWDIIYVARRTLNGHGGRSARVQMFSSLIPPTAANAIGSASIRMSGLR